MWTRLLFHLLTQRPVSSRITWQDGRAANYCFPYVLPVWNNSKWDQGLLYSTPIPNIITVTWVTSKLQKVLELEYRLDQIYEV
jgi:hypothetical protein